MMAATATQVDGLEHLGLDYLATKIKMEVVCETTIKTAHFTSSTIRNKYRISNTSDLKTAGIASYLTVVF